MSDSNSDFSAKLYKGFTNYDHRTIGKIGVLLANLGTPDAPTKEKLKPYLKEFLSDQRVIELPKWKWQLILNLFILPFRPKRSAKLYSEVWTERGSPLLSISEDQGKALQELLDKHAPGMFQVEVGMRIGNPNVSVALNKLRESGITKLLAFPLFPQYSGSTTASAFDGVVDELKTWRWLPEFRMITTYHDDELYIEALANSVREVWQEKGRPDKLLMSFHGIPKRYFDNGDPYHCLCHKTGRLVAEKLGLSKDQYIVSFQSLFGKEEWIKPYTDATLEALAKSGVKRVDAMCPGFSADCLETLEEIAGENCHLFLENGGKEFNYIPALNTRADHLHALAALVLKHTQGWRVWSKEEAELCGKIVGEFSEMQKKALQANS